MKTKSIRWAKVGRLRRPVSVRQIASKREAEAPKLSAGAIYSGVLSTTALVISALAFWASSLAPAAINLVLPRNAAISMSELGQLQILMPLVFWNEGARTGIIQDTHLVLKSEVSGRNINLIPYSYFKNDGTNVKYGDEVSPEIILGHTTGRKDIVYRAEAPQSREFGKITPGAYSVQLLYYEGPKNEKKFSDTARFIIDSTGANWLEVSTSAFKVWPFRFLDKTITKNTLQSKKGVSHPELQSKKLQEDSAQARPSDVARPQETLAARMLKERHAVDDKDKSFGESAIRSRLSLTSTFCDLSQPTPVCDHAPRSELASAEDPHDAPQNILVVPQR